MSRAAVALLGTFHPHVELAGLAGKDDRLGQIPGGAEAVNAGADNDGLGRSRKSHLKSSPWVAVLKDASLT